MGVKCLSGLSIIIIIIIMIHFTSKTLHLQECLFNMYVWSSVTIKKACRF